MCALMDVEARTSSATLVTMAAWPMSRMLARILYPVFTKQAQELGGVQLLRMAACVQSGLEPSASMCQLNPSAEGWHCAEHL